MSWNGAGVFNRIYSWVADKNAGIDITASRMDTDTDDITSNGFGNTLTRDGQGSATANLPMNGFRHTGVGNGVARSDYMALGQTQDGAINWAVATGTADAIAASYAPGITVLVDGQFCFFRATASNATTTPTFSPNGLTAHTITKAGGAALAIADIPGNLAECIVRYNLANTRWELMNPASGVVGPGSSTDGHFALFNGATGKIIKDGGATIAPVQLANSAIAFGAVMLNGTLVQSQAGNAQTFAIKTLAGSDPSATDPVYFLFRNVTAATGDYTVATATAALNITIPSGQGIGFSNATPGRIWIGAILDTGSVSLFVINVLTGTSIFPLQGWGITNGPTSGVSGAASSGVMYSTTGHTSKPYITLGYATWEVGGTLGTAGIWNVAPTRLQLFQTGTVPLPGQVIQEQQNYTGAVATGSTTIPYDDTIPQNTEGDQYMSQAITPTSSANKLFISHIGYYANSAIVFQTAALFQDSTANALAAGSFITIAAGNIWPLPLDFDMLAGTISATTFKVRAGGSAAGTTTFNGVAGARRFAGVMASMLSVQEIMA